MRRVSGAKRGIILLSGGIDSAITLYWAQDKGYRLTALIFDYSQRHKKEIRCARDLAAGLGVPYYVIRTDLSWTKSSLTDTCLPIPRRRRLSIAAVPVTYVSGRNIIFLSYAFSLAESIRAQSVFIGAHIQDYSGYPDCRPGFLAKFQQAAGEGLKSRKIKIVAPLINKNKRDIIALGLKLGVPFDHTWSCYQGKKNPCGSCDSCRFRAEGFRALGLSDPLLAKR
jgi:7-cyano-7-deazaguanine synthase